MSAEQVYRRSSVISRADLAAGFGNEALLQSIAQQLGWEQRPVHDETSSDDATIVAGSETLSEMPSIAPYLDSSGYPNDIADVSLWLPVHFAHLAPLPEWKPEPGATWDKPQRAAYRPLAPWSVLCSRLQKAMREQPGSRIDVPRLVNQIARRELVHRVPRIPHRRRGDELIIVIDKSVPMIPFDFDQEYVIQALQKERSKRRVHLMICRDPRQLRYTDRTRRTMERDTDQPPPFSDVLVLSDLGLIGGPQTRTKQLVWQTWGRQQRLRGCNLTALAPCQPDQVTERIRSVFKIQHWQTTPVRSTPMAARNGLVDELLKVASPATCRLEPGLLRDLRSILAIEDASIETTFWLSTDLASRHEEAATLEEDALDKFLPKFEKLDDETRRYVLERIRAWHLPLETGERIWSAEYESLSDESQALLPENDRAAATQSIQQLETARHDSATRTGREAAAFCSRRSAVVSSAGTIRNRTIRRWRNDYHVGQQPADGTEDPGEVTAGDLRQICIAVNDQNITAVEDFDVGVTMPQPDVSLCSQNSMVRIGPQSVTHTELRFWKTPPQDFVSDFGRDEFGAWCEVTIPRQNGDGDVAVRFRWIPAGTFFMGSPEGETDRYDDEGPLHEVTISRGYWLGETACTQELWKAVTGQNPSRFKGDDLPVEKVSWDDTQKFFAQVEEFLPRLVLRLPTEAQWEFACRAGTSTRYNFGHTVTKDDANYGGMNGTTVSVRSYLPNGWGLYQMHGNVWEWCRDWGAKDYYSSSLPVDPEGPDSGSDRVIRGGSWDDDAGDVRSAFRDWVRPDVRSSLLGFRCLSSAIAEPTEGAEVPVAEQGSERTQGGGAEHVFRASSKHADDAERKKLQLRTTRFVSTDLEEVRLERTPKPDWAVDFGRDRYGAFASFAIDDVCQRMRWIPPGKFDMGSPEGEPGRLDRELLHPVTITAGFWMFDTPCTQALWLAVMKGDNPCRFPDAERPVEKVSWKDATAFCEKLSNQVKALEFNLPSEAQWEYACRAGTATPLYSGPIQILGDANAPALDDIAWYGGNSGYEFDLENPESVKGFTWLSDKQYEFEAAGTRKVALKAPNPWGLYDMLGNVFEWCSDWWDEDYYQVSGTIDPRGPEEGSNRVFRGGSWGRHARYVRSAYRNWLPPDYRNDNLGFRCMSSCQSRTAGAEQVSAARTISRGTRP